MEPQRQILLNQTPYTLQDLYNRYAGMLLGYLSEIVKDHQKAEQHLVSIFNAIPQHLHEINNTDTNIWCQLQRLAKKHLSDSFVVGGGSHLGNGINTRQDKNKFLDRMTDEQQLIFSSIYYNHKTTLQLAKELNKPEDLIRTTLKEAFAIIRKGL
ncbi:sigma-70 RNA polymerase sigma factor region 4 domain-containing protein [Mucilaginibacter polytrichastri]|uniref:RNA polymerase sigma-70 region 4 domain-containing protein n=1 Tax=Mucilaginibacter polytrichastri TaxID=1302689 RepID=A0A1Q6A365_9SPHI|nr:sigma-70 family RNA polymerase sigma factor [Mucilaginibacter polytrichastri]OKS88453.1 hypothetical protein RG47T_3920 [Mucilaginibacter polytrichastri]